jgi:N-acetylglucosamine-6-phosphate deacetylase
MLPQVLFHNARIFNPTGVFEPGWLLVEGRSIEMIGSGNPPLTLLSSDMRIIDAGMKNLLPGFIDLHVHGALGCDTMDATVEALQTISKHLAAHGVTSFLAATWTASDDQITKALENITRCYGRIEGGASLLGAYLEGPYINPNRAGAQVASAIRSATDHAVIEKWLEEDMIRVVSLAPEFPENLWLVDECVKRGITVAAGHTAATYEEMQVAVAHGVSHLTHCFNAMGTLHHRQPGVIGAGLTMPELRCELIADNIHVHPVVQQLLYQARGPYGMLLVSDSTRTAGLPDGEYDLDVRKVVVKGNEAHLANGTLAGSRLSLDQGLKNFRANVKKNLAELWPVVSLTPARAIGIAHQKGVLETGHNADLVLLDEELAVKMTMVEGEIVYQA